MRIAGFVRNSFVDYPGKIAAVLFLPGCNWDCFFCHNRDLIAGVGPTVEEEEVWAHLERRRGLLDGVVVTGGEPTLHAGLPDLLRRIRSLGLLCKLDTNGSRPEVVEALLAEGLLDYVALDIKTLPGEYRSICGPAAEPDAVWRTLSLLRSSGVAFECRTTFLPQLTVEDIAELAALLAPVPRWALQAYRQPERYRPEDRLRVEAAAHPPEEMRRAAEAARGCAGEVTLR